MALIILRDICMHFGDAAVLDHVNLTVAQGERICLLGRNGVGKSTLMGIVAGRSFLGQYSYLFINTDLTDSSQRWHTHC